MKFMEETQFSLEVWNQLPKPVKESDVQMIPEEVAWKTIDSLPVIEAFKGLNIAVNGIEFFYFNKITNQIFATMDIFSCDKGDHESWQEFVKRSCEKAETFVLDVEFDEDQLKQGEPIFNIWAITEAEYFDLENAGY